MQPSTPYLRLSLLALLSAWGADASALGLGELRSRSYLGEPFAAEVEILAASKEVVDAGCFRLRSPQGDADLPWLRRASFSLRRGDRLLLEIRSEVPLRDPVLQVGIAVGCGHEVQRDYTLFLSPRGRDSETSVQAAAPPVVSQPSTPPAATRRQLSPPEAGESPSPRLVPRKAEKRAKPAFRPDRLVLSSGGDAAGEPSLRLATELMAWKDEGRSVGEAQRELLRLEYRMLAAMNEQATSQLAAAEKLRNMETTLAELQQRANEFAGRIEKGVAPAGQAAGGQATAPSVPSSVATSAAPELPAALPPARPTAGVSPEEKPGLLSEWSFYGAMLGAVLGVGGWLGWRQYRDRRRPGTDFDEPVLETVVDPVKPMELDELAEADYHVGLVAADTPMPADLVQEADKPAEAPAAPTAVEAVAMPPGAVSTSTVSDSPPAVVGSTVSEHFEVNPVMELAEIMLSFGRVKGAAQALQEYIDHNPEEALQPWIRLMDVYRMAGMREEFDQLAQNLNQHFNVEVQQWNPEQESSPLDKPLDFILDGEAEGAAPSPLAPPKALTLEDIGHIRNKLIECWGSGECLDYLNQLLRDNRGGKRSGFTLPVVEEILFLIELIETRTAMEKQAVNGGKNV